MRERGCVRTSKIVASVIADLAFDWKYGTDTRRMVWTDSLETDSENKSHAISYQATKARPFLSVLGQLRLPEDSVFVDLGSGKGRALLLASQHRFKRVVGLEFCSRLCAQARANVDLFRQKARACAPIEIVETDVTRYRFRGDENVFYLFHPFDSLVLSQVLESIGRSIEEKPRKIWLIYNTPEHREVIEQAGLFAPPFHVYESGGTEFRVYAN